MSFDLGVWVESGAVSVEQAAQRYARLCAGDGGGAVGHRQVVAFCSELFGRFPALEQVADEDVDGCPWSAGASTTGDSVVLCLRWSAAEQVGAVVRELALEHGLVCYDPQAGRVWQAHAGVMAAGVRLTSCDGSTWTDPDLAGIREALGAVTAQNWYLLLEGADERWLQVGYGPNAGAGPGGYVLERCEGSVEEVYRTRLSAAEDAVPAFQAFAQGDPGWVAGFAWTRVEL